jgi:hypothetical protein
MTTAIRQPMSPTLAQAGGAPSPAPDSWLDALSKLVPGEVIVAFTAALQLPSIGDQLTPHLAILILFAALVPAALWRSARRAGTAAPLLQYVVRTAMFVLYGLGTDSFLAQQLNDLRLSWIPGVVGIALALFAALVLSPPGAAAPPPARA